MGLELNKLTHQVGQMGQAMAARQHDHEVRVQQARTTFARSGPRQRGVAPEDRPGP